MGKVPKICSVYGKNKSESITTLLHTYTTDTANVFHTDFLIKDTELSNR